MKYINITSKVLVILSFYIVITSCENKKEKGTIKKSEKFLFSKLEKQTLTILNYEKLRTVKKEIENKSEIYLVPYKSLIEVANEALNEGPFSVTNKTQLPPSGDKRDYMSIGPYWWPDTKKPDGLPWIRRDGQVNPLTEGNNLDLTRKNKMFRNVYRLAMAHYFTGNKTYANKAIELLKVWFLDEKTKMNPNLDYAQAIPGKTIGRGIGIIEFIGVKELISTIDLLELNNAMNTSISEGLRLWLKDYLYWLQHSKNGLDEKKWPNNHGTWYDVQEVSILMFLHRFKEAKQVLEISAKDRIKSQIGADGTLPLELERTRSLHYTAYNLEAFTYLAYFGKQLNVDLWNYHPHKAGSIQDAYHFLDPYIIKEKEWMYTEISGVDNGIENLKELFLMAGNMFNIREYSVIGLSMNESDNFKILSYSF
ncbi:alginate lyase family protein [uncultured Algibacter sp.]|uniref:alginate lyase family protein n=1 Tax=uncultured Algibacter sp. TaxID=298659 RepID=UPI002633E458|nr:alginate lyase family protein [uncultured Algibacter sp.]